MSFLKKFEVVEEIPSDRDLMSFDYFDNVPVGTILTAESSIGIKLDNGMTVCDIGSVWCKKYLREIKGE